MKHKCVPPDAIADIYGSDIYPNLLGQVRFYQRCHCVLVEAIIKGLPVTKTGFFGFHIHSGDNCMGTDFANTKSHYNPTEALHPVHAGDLPPLLSCHQNAYSAVLTGRFHVAEVIGRTVVVHDMADDFRTQPSGNSGTKIACGVIKKV